MKTAAFDLTEETSDTCRDYGLPSSQMSIVAYPHTQSLRDGKIAEIDLRELVIELDKSWDREPSQAGKRAIAKAAGECRRLLLRLHAEETAKLAIQGAKDAGVQQWKLQSLLSQIYGDSF